MSGSHEGKRVFKIPGYLSILRKNRAHFPIETLENRSSSSMSREFVGRVYQNSRLAGKPREPGKSRKFAYRRIRSDGSAFEKFARKRYVIASRTKNMEGKRTPGLRHWERFREMQWRGQETKTLTFKRESLLSRGSSHQTNANPSSLVPV